MKHTTRKQLDKILEGTIECVSGTGGSILHDDHDGTFKGHLYVNVSVDGDVWIDKSGDTSLRFRNYFGGGNSLLVHNALQILAYAIEKEKSS